MNTSIFSVVLSCFNMTVNFFTRLFLILLSAYVYQSFIVAEMFLNSYNLVYPPYLAKPMDKVLRAVSVIATCFVQIIAVQTIMLNFLTRRLLKYSVFLLGLFVRPLLWLLSLCAHKKERCPSAKSPILLKSATELSAMIRNREITSEQVVEIYVNRCKEVNPYINAIVEARYEAALREARGIDKMVASCNRTPEDLAVEYPLLGVPMTVKESIAVEGMSNDSGTVTDPRKPATRDAACIRLARAAGAIPIAVTSTPQYCMNWETYNNVIGITSNPYDPTRTTGGSSGGESALIASAGSIVGVGSDIAGSLRLPPMFTGIFGHKPTPRFISVEGHVPDCLDPEFEEYFTLGPITRYAEDLTLMLKVLKKPGGPHIPLDTPVDITKLNFYYMEGDGSNISNDIGSDVKDALKRAKDHLKSTYNIDVRPLKIDNIEHMWETSVRILMNINHIRNIYTDPQNREKWVSVWPELLKTMFCMSKHNFLPVCYGPLKKFFDTLPKCCYRRALSKFGQIKSEFEKVLSNDGVLLYPTFPDSAHKHYHIYYKFLNCGYLSIFNALGLPVTQCPIGLTKERMPVGIQIAANKCNDHLTIAVAKEFERAFGGWIPPSESLEEIQFT